MPYSFTKIEKDKSTIIGFVFLFLIVFYIFIILGFALLFKCFWLSLQQDQMILRWNVFNGFELIIMTLIATLSALAHYFISTFNLTPRTLRWLNAKEPDGTLVNQQLFLNIIEEVRVATGNAQFHGLIIPSTSLNAFALDDDEHAPIIGITQGALLKLTRPQLEAVIAYQAASILKGDCFIATLVSAMFEFYMIPIKGNINHRQKSWHVGNNPTKNHSPDADIFRVLGRIGPIVIVFLLIIGTFYFVTGVVATLMRMFISRQSKLRADAVAVRLTRNPISLAQALRILSEDWNGVGNDWEAMQGVFIINPKEGCLDQKHGLTADLFSTHPPLKERLNILLDMAHLSEDQLHASVKHQIEDQYMHVESDSHTTGTHVGKRWLLNKDDRWFGPFLLNEIGMVSWLSNETLVKQWGSNHIYRAVEDEQLKGIISSRPQIKTGFCPTCQYPLVRRKYEGEDVSECEQCHGMVLGEDQAGVIMARRVVNIPDDIRLFARKTLEEMRSSTIHHVNHTHQQNGFCCPQCANARHKMQTRVFNSYYPVVIDKCLVCGYMWFEMQEIEVLQAMYEIKNPKI